MATVTKDFRVKAGLVVEGSTATVDGHDILTEGLVDAKGDLLVASGADAVTRVALGTNGYILTADDSETAGVKWAAAPAVGTFESSITFEGATADSYETTLTVTDPTADRTITLPDATGTVALTSDIDALDTDDIEEGATNKYFATGLVDDHLSGGDGITYSTGTISADVAGGLEITSGQIVIDRDTTDTWYDASGAAGSVASDLTDHENATEAHGATGAVVGTTNTQTLSNKTISYTDNTITVQVANVSDLTASASELNTLDGITASTSELNILDGVTADYTELNVLDGITSSTAELNILDGVTADYTELNILDGATLSTTELNYVDGVTSAIQDQLDDKAPLESPSLTGTPLAPTATAGDNSTQIATTAFVSTAVANLVDGAPALLDTLNELAAAINDDENFASSIGTSIGEKVAKSGDTMTGALTLHADPSSDMHAATKQYVDAAQEAAEDYADGLATNYEASGAVSTHSGLTTGVHGVTGDVVGTSDTQTLTGKTIDGASNTLTVRIADDVSGLGTDVATFLATPSSANLASAVTDETGTGSLVFADTPTLVTPVLGAATATSIAFADALLGSALATAGTSATTIDTWSATTYSSAKYIVQMKNGNDIEVIEVLVTIDGNNNVYLTEYADVISNAVLGTTNAVYSSGNVLLQVTGAAADTAVKVSKTYIEA